MITATYCTQCPRRCGANRLGGEVGYCGAGREVRVAKVMLHEWEEPCFGGRAGAVFFAGCPLRCEYCQNRAISRPEESGIAGEVWTRERMGREFLDLQARGATCLDLVSPTQYTADIVAVLREVKPLLRIPVVWNTGGYELPETIRALAGLVDCFLTDFKYGTAETAARYSQAPDYPEVALAALKEMVKVMGVPPAVGNGGDFPKSPEGGRPMVALTREMGGSAEATDGRPIPPCVENTAGEGEFSTVPPYAGCAAFPEGGRPMVAPTEDVTGACVGATIGRPSSPATLPPIVLRHLVLPNCRRDSMAVLKMIAAGVGVQSVTLSLMCQYTPDFAPADFPELARRVTTFEYESVRACAVSLGFEGFGQEKASATRAFTPDFGK